MRISERPFTDQADLYSMLDLVRTIRSVSGDHKAYLHVGDIEWRFFRHIQSSGEDPHQTIYLFEDGHMNLIGFAWLNRSTLDSVINPELPQALAQKLIESSIQWAETIITAHSHTELTCIAGENDELLTHVLSAYGYQKEYTDAIMRADLNEHPYLEGMHTVSGYTIRSITSKEVDKLTALRQAGTQRDLSVEQYSNLLAMPDYSQALHIIAVAPSGDFAAHALGWADQANRIGLFEPVATHPDYRRLGLGKAVLLECMRRMRAQGLTRVLVTPDSANQATVALYASVGFREHRPFSGWKKTLSKSLIRLQDRKQMISA